MLLSPLLEGPQSLIWFSFFVFVALHLGANYLAVSSLVFDTLNPQRACLVIDDFLSNLKPEGSPISVLTPEQVAQREKILGFGAHRKYNTKISFGARIHQLMQNDLGTNILCLTDTSRAYFRELSVG